MKKKFVFETMQGELIALQSTEKQAAFREIRGLLNGQKILIADIGRYGFENTIFTTYLAAEPKLQGHLREITNSEKWFN